MSMHDSFNRSGLSRFINSRRGRIFRLIAGVAFLVIGFAFRHHTFGILSMVWSVIPLSAGVFNWCYFSALLGGPLSSLKIRNRYQADK